MEQRDRHPRSRQSGFVVSGEVLLIAVILVCGLVTGWAKLRDQSLAEIKDSISAIDAYVAGATPLFQTYAQPWIAGGLVSSAPAAPATEENFGLSCIVVTGVGCVAVPPIAPAAGAALTLEYGTGLTPGVSGSAASFEASTF
jgi:hypothetical protein